MFQMGRNRQRNNPWEKAFFNLLNFLGQKKALYKMKLVDGLQVGTGLFSNPFQAGKKCNMNKKKEENQLQLRASGKTVLK